MTNAWDNLPDPLKDKKADFDTSVYDNKKSTITLLNVNWDTEYNHVVDWKSEAERDAWFDSQVDAVEIETGWSLNAGNTLRLSEPHTSVRNFNYIVVNMYADPVESESPERKLKYFYFASGTNKINPSVSEVTLKLDTWTTYSTTTEIASIKLERGHYPHAVTPASKYLANPLENNIGVTAVEPDLPAIKPLVSFEKFVSSQKSAPRIVVAMTADLQNPDSLWLDVHDATTIKRPTGKQLPPDYWWESTIVIPDTSYLGSNGYAPTPPVAPTIANGSVLGVSRYYSMSISNYTSFIELCRKKLPQVLKTIQSVYVIDSSLLTESGATFAFYTVTGLRTLVSTNGQYLMDTIGFSKAQFNYDPKYDDFAKLYTNQFAVVEVSNLNGQKVEISIEDVSESLEVYNRISHLFPFIKLEAFINGVGGKANTRYTVQPLNSLSASLFSSQWEDYKFELEVPTYAIVASAREVNGPEAQAELWDTTQRAYNEKYITDGNTYLYNRVTNNSLSADLANNQNSINNTKTNQLSSIDRSYTNDSETISKDFSNTSETINKDYTSNSELIAAAQEISDSTVLTEYDNSIYNAIAVRDMTTKAIDVTKMVSENNNTLLNSTSLRSLVNDWTTADYELTAKESLYHATRDINSFDSKLGIYSTWIAARVGIMATTTNGIGAIVGGIASANLGAIASSAIGAATEIDKAEKIGGLNIEVAKLRAMVSTNTGNVHAETTDTDYESMIGGNIIYDGQSLGTIAIEYQQDVGYYAINNHRLTVEENLNETVANNTVNINVEWVTAGEIADAVKTLSNYVTEQNKTLGLGINVLRSTTDTNVNDRTKSVNEIIASRNNVVSGEIASRNKTIDDAIANANYDADNTNLNRGYTADSENLTDSVTNRLGNAEIVNNMQSGSAMKNYLEEVIQAPTVYLENSSNGWTDAWGHRGLDVRIRRCSKGTEKRAGDIFSRYGYYTDGLWIESPALSQMTKFTFWKAEEAWIIASHIDETNKEILRNIFKRGTTVWVNPEELLRIDITTNKTRSI